MYIVGASTLGEMVLETAMALDVVVEAFVDDVRTEREWCGIPIAGGLDWLLARSERTPGISAFVAIGDNENRARIVRRLGAAGVTLRSLVHPDATVSPSVRIGNANLIMALSYLGTGVVVGDGNLVLPHVCLGHHNTIGNFSFLAPGVSVGGRAAIGDFAKIGMNSVVEPDSIVPPGFTCAPLTRVGGSHDA